MKAWILIVLLLSFGHAQGQKILIPMDLVQSDHLKAYGVAFAAIEQGYDVEWLLNYRGGAFLTDTNESLIKEARLRNVRFELISNAKVGDIYAEIGETNADRIKLESAPRIAIYTPPNKQPWDDAVTLALTYAEIPYDTLWDDDVLTGQLAEYDWLHLHHEDFTGQYGKFYRSHGRELWYRQQQRTSEEMAKRLGFTKETDAVKVEYDLMNVWPKSTWTPFSSIMILHGRDTCNARKPKCDECLLVDICPKII